MIPKSDTSSWGAILILLAAAIPAQIDLAPKGAERLRAELDQITAVADDSRWQDAADQLVRLLTEFEDSDHARLARTDIVDLDRRCRFGLEYRPPELQSLVSGKLLKYTPKTRHIRLRYSKKGLGDFENVGRILGPIFRHEALFSSYRVAIKGKSYSSTRLVIWTNQGSVYRITVGVPPRGPNVPSYTPTVIQANTKSEPPKVLLEKHWGADRGNRRSTEQWYRLLIFPMKLGKPYKIELSASSTRVSAKCNGRSLGGFVKPRSDAYFGIEGSSFDTIEIDGKLHGSWLENKLDAHRSAALNRFQRTYDAKKCLPPWLFTKAGGMARPAVAEKMFPGKEAPKRTAYLHNLLTLLRAEKFGQLLSTLERFQDQVPTPVHDFLSAHALLGLGKHKLALEHALACYEADPEFGRTAQLLGTIFAVTRKFDSAEKYYLRMLELSSHRVENYAGVAEFLVQLGRHATARDVLNRAARAGLEDVTLTALRRLVLKAENGPDWPRRLTNETEHFRIVSDIDAKVCKDAGTLLENGLQYFERMLGKIVFPQSSIPGVHLLRTQRVRPVLQGRSHESASSHGRPLLADTQATADLEPRRPQRHDADDSA